jgi:hypothetical protein
VGAGEGALVGADTQGHTLTAVESPGDIEHNPWPLGL